MYWQYHYQAKLDAFGPSRGDQSIQRIYIGRMAMRFQVVTQMALLALYSKDPVFRSSPELNLITRIIRLNEDFADIFWKKEHFRNFEQNEDNQDQRSSGRNSDGSDFRVLLNGLLEFSDFTVLEEYKCPEPSHKSTTDHIAEVLKFCRWPELELVRFLPKLLT